MEFTFYMWYLSAADGIYPSVDYFKNHSLKLDSIINLSKTNKYYSDIFTSCYEYTL